MTLEEFNWYSKRAHQQVETDNKAIDDASKGK